MNEHEGCEREIEEMKHELEIKENLLAYAQEQMGLARKENAELRDELERRSAEVSMLRYQLRAADDRADMRTQEMKTASGNPWRACVQVLPEIHKWVLVRCLDNSYSVDSREKHEGSRDGWRWFSGDEDITHWTPIPKFGEKE